MKRSVLTTTAGLLLASMALAQPGGPGGPDDRPGPPPRGGEERHEGDRGDRRDGDRREGPRGEGSLPGGPRPGGNMPGRPGPLEVMKNFLDVIDRFNNLGKDADASAVAAVINTVDILRPRGGQAVIDRLEKMLGEAKSSTVQRVIRLQLADFYRQTNQADKALEHLDALIRGSN